MFSSSRLFESREYPFRISRDVPNQETIETNEEVRRLKNDPNKKTYNSFKEFMKNMEDEV